MIRERVSVVPQNSIGSPRTVNLYANVEVDAWDESTLPDEVAGNFVELGMLDEQFLASASSKYIWLSEDRFRYTLNMTGKTMFLARKA